MHPSLTNPFTTSAASVMRAVEPAAAPVTRPTSAAAAEPIHDQTDCISEIFVGARKIVWADEPPLREEPIPLFLTQAHIQLDQELTEFIASNWCRRSGKIAGLKGETAKPPHDIGTPAHDKWMEGHAAGQSSLMSSFQKLPVDDEEALEAAE